jgi:hypothetical protein
MADSMAFSWQAEWHPLKPCLTAALGFMMFPKPKCAAIRLHRLHLIAILRNVRDRDTTPSLKTIFNRIHYRNHYLKRMEVQFISENLKRHEDGATNVNYDLD